MPGTQTGMCCSQARGEWHDAAPSPQPPQSACEEVCQGGMSCLRCADSACAAQVCKVQGRRQAQGRCVSADAMMNALCRFKDVSMENAFCICNLVGRRYALSFARCMPYDDAVPLAGRGALEHSVLQSPQSPCAAAATGQTSWASVVHVTPDPCHDYSDQPAGTVGMALTASSSAPSTGAIGEQNPSACPINYIRDRGPHESKG